MSSSTASPVGTWSPEPQRILIRGVNWLGDAVMTTPALLRVRERFPQAHITLLIQEKIAEAFRHHPAFDELCAFSADDTLWSIGRRLRKERFELALVLPNSPRSALETWLGRVPRRVGYARPWRNWFLTEAVSARPGHAVMRKRSNREINHLIKTTARRVSSYTPTSHQLHDYLHLAAIIGAKAEPLMPTLVVTADESDAARSRLRAAVAGQSSHNVILGVCPGAQYGPAKRWPVERFASVVRDISLKVPGCFWLALGGPQDREPCAELARTAGAHVVSFAGQTSLRELMALLKLCQVVLTNDSGPMHVAAALGSPVVVPFGSTAPELTGPGLPGDSRHRLLRSHAPCSPCFRRACPIDLRCMHGIEVESVVKAMLEVIA